MIFPSKRDAWVTTMLSVTAMSMIAVACHLMFAGDGPIGIMSVLLLGGALLTIWVLHETSYEIGPSALVIRCGPITTAIPVDSIFEIAPSSDPSSAPALSLDRLCIQYVWRSTRRAVLISPERRRQFLGTLARAVPDLRFDGERAIRASAQPLA